MSFVEDFKKLQLATPRIAIVNTNSENSAYTNYSTFNRNCYLCFGTHYSEDAYYSQYGVGLNSCADSFDLEKSELCYEMVFSEKCYNCSFGSYLIACTDCEFCHDMSNSTKCFLCTGLQNQNYCILNQQYSKNEYEKLVPRIIEHMSGSRASAPRERETERKSGFASLSEVELYKKEI